MRRPALPSHRRPGRSLVRNADSAGSHVRPAELGRRRIPAGVTADGEDGGVGGDEPPLPPPAQRHCPEVSVHTQPGWNSSAIYFSDQFSQN